ncbi:MAG: NAD(P)H-hydrate epimerase [Candidatus Micrarchaeota archaeon]
MISVAEMVELEKKAEARGVSKLQLMERAGKGIADVLAERFPEKKIVFACWHGNNGGDGFAAARYLLDEGFAVRVWFAGVREKLVPEAKANFARLSKTVFTKGVHDADVVVDCLLGTGSKKALEGPLAEAVKEINASSAFVVSVDVPTGVDPYSGKSKGGFVDCDLLLSIHDLKKGLGRFAAKSVTVNIGLRAFA